MSPQIACLRMQSLIGCICLTILHCAFTDAPSASSEHLNQRKYIYIGCICFSFLPCAFSNVSSNGPPQTMPSHTGCICMVFLHCAFSNLSSNCDAKSHWLHLFDFLPHFVFSNVCPRRCIITLVGFVRLFSTVHFQMCPQIACLRRCKVTLVAFI